MSWTRLLSSLALGAGLFILLELGLVSVVILTSLTYMLLAAILPSGNSEPVSPANKAVFITGMLPSPLTRASFPSLEYGFINRSAFVLT